ncbi:YfgM family protein [Litchfieldella xinjiangensis]|uniref:YfgM family protein n=1 Tax=Litchfieldella xinjiangensis TaxID=1166948 RepID=UPI0005BE09E8|nr:tetratricopeptide repeat protein [Halomonas xinjiangensis]
MAELRTEEEQLEAIKRWWKENGKSLIAGVVIAVAGVVGWNAWQDYQANQAEAASLRYQQLVALASQDTLDESTRSEARDLADTLINEHDDRLYADLAGLIEARLAVAEGDLIAAQTALGDVIGRTSQDYIKSLARLRLARLQVATEDADAALETLEQVDAAPLAAQRANIRGDAFIALGDEAQAREAYREALTLAEQNEQPLYGVELKLDNLGTQEATL